MHKVAVACGWDRPHDTPNEGAGESHLKGRTYDSLRFSR
jgi:hypothetical protein